MTHGNWKTSLKQFLSQARVLPLVRALHYRVQMASDQHVREREGQLDRDFRRFAADYGATFRQAAPPPSAETPRVLVVSSGSLGQLVEIALVTAFRLAGYHPLILTDYDRWMEAYYHETGVKDILSWDDCFHPVPVSDAVRMMESIATFEQLIKADYRGARVGKYAASTVLRHLRVGRLDLSAQPVRDALLPFLHRAMCYAKTAQDIVDTFRPQLVLSVDTGYSPRGELFDICLASGIDTITWNAAHRNNQLMLKRYSPRNREVHPASLSVATWSALQAKRWSAADRDLLRRELVGSYTSGEWYGEVGTQFHTTLQDAGAVRRTLNLEGGKKTVVIFPHIFWDGTFFYGTDLFESYEEWFVETMKVAYANPAVNWIVKIHPANLVKNIRDGVGSEPSELAALRQLGGEPPPHVRIIQPDSRLSTLSLYSVMDYCVTVRGTVGIEAASFGIPVLTAGTGRYDRLGFTVDSDSKAQYLERLAHIQHVPALTAQERELAERFAYGVFIARPLTLSTVALEYQRDARASLQTRVCLPKGQGLQASADLHALATWIQSGQEDFLSPHV